MRVTVKYSTLKLIHHKLTVVLSLWYLFPFPIKKKANTKKMRFWNRKLNDSFQSALALMPGPCVQHILCLVKWLRNILFCEVVAKNCFYHVNILLAVALLQKQILKSQSYWVSSKPASWSLAEEVALDQKKWEFQARSVPLWSSEAPEKFSFKYFLSSRVLVILHNPFPPAIPPHPLANSIGEARRLFLFPRSFLGMQALVCSFCTVSLTWRALWGPHEYVMPLSN